MATKEHLCTTSAISCAFPEEVVCYSGISKAPNESCLSQGLKQEQCERPVQVTPERSSWQAICEDNLYEN